MSIAPTKPQRRVAIVGRCADSCLDAPFDDPSWEIWGLSKQYKADGNPGGFMPRWDRWFELHDFARFRADMEKYGDYIRWLQQIEAPLYVQEKQPDMPRSVAYPRDEILRAFDFGSVRNYFSSSMAWMMALAMQEGVDEIGLWGVNMAAQDEYGYQRPCCEFLLGIAAGRGIKVTIPAESELCKCRGLYGFAENLGAFPKKLAVRRKELLTRKEDAQAKHKELTARLFAIHGALAALEPIVAANGTAAEVAKKQFEEISNVAPVRAKEAEQWEKLLWKLDGALEDLEWAQQWS